MSRRQLRLIGLSDSAIKHRVSVKRLLRVHRSVYAVALPLLPRARYMAAVLAGGENAYLSHRASAAHFGMRGPPAGPIDVTIHGRPGRNRPGIVFHVARSLPDHQVTTEDRIPCTTPMRTFVDLATVVRHPRELQRALERSLELRLFDRNAIEEALAGSSGRRGMGLLRRLVANLPDETPPIASELERRFLELVCAAALPYPVVNGHIGDLQVDFHWPAQRLVVETDGRATHEHAIAFQRDRSRDLELALADWHVIRLTWRQVVDTPELVVAALRRRLSQR